MKMKHILALCGLLAVMAACATSQAGVTVGIGIGVPAPYPYYYPHHYYYRPYGYGVYVAPGPVYYAPPPPPVYYAPPPAYVAPVPAYPPPAPQPQQYLLCTLVARPGCDPADVRALDHPAAASRASPGIEPVAARRPSSQQFTLPRPVSGS